MVLLLVRVVPNPVAVHAIPMDSMEDYPDPNVRWVRPMRYQPAPSISVMLVSPFELTFSLVPIRCVFFSLEGTLRLISYSVIKRRWKLKSTRSGFCLT